ncbi:hypothetical protein [Nonomuraea sp. SBT364]|uniref:hypothetical protein n=1 Tax=Nonomuraea sp. SBT364 TaxID=1580530 RepID=UPI00066A6932|nr:hypothetical protein [Nonomuraea sp. SBT364]
MRGSRYRYAADAGGLDQIGIALGGGGVRAACLGLGALQAAEESGVLARARYVSAVSGGSYTATAFLTARARAESGEGPPPWSRGSPEEEHLRRNLRYLGEDSSDLFLGATRYLLTLLVNLVPLAAVIVLAGCMLGAAYRAGGLLVPVDDLLYARLVEQRLALVAAISVAGVFLEGRFGRAERSGRRAVLGLVAGLLLPDVVALTTRLLDARTFDASAGVRLAGLAAVLGAVAIAVFRTQWGFSASLVRRLLLQLLRLLFSAAMVAALVLPLLLAVGQASQLPYAVTGSVAGGAALVLLVFALAVHANRTSLHRTYSRRLDRAYLVRAGADPVRLSQVTLADTHADGLPHLLVCASVNLRANESAEGECCASFVFSAGYVGSAAIGEAPREVAHRLRASSLVAASGAAVAPNMGRYTGRASRIALALMNLRLGLWLPNPVVPRPPGPAAGRLPRWLVEGWYEPGPLSTWRETIGDLSKEHRYLFVSDGGHWDNSGVVELLRRRCRTVFAVDASVDDLRLGNALRLISLARAELGVEFEADGRLLASHAPVVTIKFSYPDDTADSPAGNLVLLRTHISADMPSDLVALATDGSGFPRHSTLNQFLGARDVDAYVALGRWLFQRGLVAADLPPADVRAPSRPPG